MKAALISMNSESSSRIREALEKTFDEVEHIDIRNVEMRIGKGKSLVLCDGKELKNDFDCVYLKSSFRYAVVQQALATFFDGKAYMPIKPGSFSVVNDKMLTHLALEKAGIPTPETYITPTVAAAKSVLKELNFPIILKIPGGTHGKGVMFAESVAAASGILDTLSELKQAVLVQEYVETGGTDVRAIVIGEEVVASMVRKAVKEEKRANIHAGGSAEAIELSREAKKVAVQAARALGADICAVDILESVKGPLVLEANLSPGLQGIMSVSDAPIPDLIAKHLAEQTKAFHQLEQPEAKTEDIVEQVKQVEGGEQQIISKIQFRGDRILLPDVVTKMAKFKEEDVVLTIKKGMVRVEKI